MRPTANLRATDAADAVVDRLCFAERMSNRIGVDEARLVAAYAQRQHSWDPATPARLVSSERALGIYTAPPMNVLAFLAMPWQGEEGLDVTVSLASVVDVMTAAAAGSGEVAVGSLVPAAPGAAALLAALPPSSDWQVPIHAIAGDLMRDVEAAREEFTARSSGLSAQIQNDIAEEIWDRPVWGGLPMRVLHAAHRLGMLRKDQSKVSAATSGPWRRFSTQRGQVFYRIPGQTARFDLRVVR